MSRKGQQDNDEISGKLSSIGIENENGNEGKFAVMFRCSPIGMSLSTFKEGRLLEVNESWLNLVGVSKIEDVLGKTTVELGLVPDEQTRERILEDFNQSDHIENLEILSQIKNGSRKNLLVKKKVVMVSGTRYILSIVEDISRRKMIEVALHESEEKYRTIVETASEGIWIVDAERQTTYVNQRMADMLGYTIDEIFTGPWTKFISSSEIPDYEARTSQRQIGLGVKESYEIKLIRKDGSQLWAIVHASPQYDNFRKYTGSISLVADITDLKQKEIALEENELKLRELIDTKDKFFNIIAHDLKNPFTSLIGSSELLSEKIDQLGRDKIRTLAYLINGASKNGYGILLNLLDWSRSQTGMLNLNSERFNLKKVINEQIKNLGHISSNKEIQISSMVKKDIYITTNKTIVNTILRNLISNAVKFSNRRGEVKINAIQEGNNYIISVKDHGIGIAPDKVKSIFELGTKLYTPGTENEQGTGLGLKLCKEFIEKTGGKIWVESTERNGSEFKFTIPVKDS